MAATTTTLQVGSINFLTDTFTSVLDLNDGVSFRTQDVQFMQPDRLYSEAFNMRTPGVAVQAAQYGNGAIRVRLYIMGANTTAILSAIHSLFSAIENPPYYLKVQLAGGSQFTYFQVVKVAKPQIPYVAQKYLSGFALGFDITFTVQPKGITLPRQYLSNLVSNPGFEAVSNAPVQVFNDSFANLNAYTLQTGGAPTQNPSNTFVDVVLNNAGANLLRYFRLGESSGTTAYDISGMANHGSYVASPTLGVAGGVSGDTDTAITLNGSTQYVDCPTTGLPTGNSPISKVIRFKFAANPAANAWLWAYGAATSGAHNVVGLFIDSTGKLHATCNTGTDSVTAAAVTTGVYHTAGFRWDGATLTVSLDGVSAASVTPGANTIPSSAGSNRFRLGATADTTAAGFFAGQLDESLTWNADIGATAISNIHTAAASGATGTVANAMSIPATPARVAFGSPAWSAINVWQIRFRFVTGLSALFFLHFTDGNNYLAVNLTGTAISLIHRVAGTSHTLASSAPVLTHEAWYWIKITQFPQLAGNTVGVQASLFYDDDGVIGSAVTNGAVGPANSQDTVTAITGQPAIQANGAALVIGGNFSSVHAVSLFGPGSWLFVGTSGTGPASGAWEQASSNTYPSGPVTSYAAARIDCPPAGTVDAQWLTFNGGAIAGSPASPVATAGDVLGFSVLYKTSAGLGANALVRVVITEYNSSGTFLRNATAASMTGPQTSWTPIAGTWTTGANCAYATLSCRVTDTGTPGTSANATVWFDDAQLWDQTACAGQSSMPFCELRFNAAPAHLMVSGLLGDAPAPAFISMAAFFASWAANATATYQLGRRAIATKGMRLCAPSLGAGQVLDSTGYGGFSVLANIGPLVYSTADEVGIYHILGRAKTGNPSPVNNVGVFPDVPEWQVPPGQQWPNIISLQEVARWDGVPVFPFTAQNTWTIVDVGQVILPPFAYTNEADLTQFVGFTSTNSGVQVSGSSQITANWVALLPVDGGVQAYGLKNPTASALTNQWLYIYSDGMRGVANYSLETTPQPNPAHAGGITVGNFNSPAISSGADSVMYLDPTFANLQNNITDVAGVNQFLLSAADGSAALLPVAVDLSYYPAYLFPR